MSSVSETKPAVQKNIVDQTPMSVASPLLSLIESESSKAPPRPSLRLLPEGWVFIVILVFVAVGAVLRNVNLLIILAGMMIAPLLLNWRVGVHMLRQMDFRRLVPQHIHVGHLVSIQWKATNLRTSLAAWNVTIEDEISMLEIPDNATRISDVKSVNLITAQAAFAQIDVGQTEFVSYRVLFNQRGVYRVGSAVASTGFPFGLIGSQKVIPEVKTFFVAPRLGELSPTWDQRLRSTAIGSEALQRRRGIDEDEFYALRRWRSGDSKRHIHWRSTAKLGRPMVKEHDQRTNRDFAIVLDLFGKSQELGPDGIDEDSHWRCETVLSFAATVFAHLGTAVQGQIGLGVCGKQCEVISDRNNHELLKRFMRSLSVARASSQDSIVSLANTIIQLAASVSSGTPIYVASSRPNPFADQVGFEIEDVQLNRQWKMVASNINWLTVGSDQFDRMFKTSRIDDQRATIQLQEKWEEAQYD